MPGIGRKACNIIREKIESYSVSFGGTTLFFIFGNKVNSYEKKFTVFNIIN